jgi:hypothetical protein
MLLLTGWPVGIMGLGGLDEVAAHEDGGLFQVLSWVSRNASSRPVCWGPGSLDLSEVPERLYDLFNHEGASFAVQCFGPE